MPATPTDSEILEVRPDLNDYLSDERTLQDEGGRALAYLKRDLLNQRGIHWAQVYDDAILFDYLTETNADNLKHAISLRVAALVFHDYAIRSDEDGQWWPLGNEYLGQYQKLIETMRIDVDLDEDGVISEEEKTQPATRFMSR